MPELAAIRSACSRLIRSCVTRQHHLRGASQGGTPVRWLLDNGKERSLSESPCQKASYHQFQKAQRRQSHVRWLRMLLHRKACTCRVMQRSIVHTGLLMAVCKQFQVKDSGRAVSRSG